MKLDLPTSVLETLPAPDNKGLVRVTIGMKVSEDGKTASLVEMNDVPMPGDDDDEEKEETKSPADEVLEPKDLPAPDDMEKAIYA